MIAAGDGELLAILAEGIRSVEDELREQMGSRIDVVAQIGNHTLGAGGKRLRPAFVALAARAIGRSFDPDRTRKVGACMEMIHMATLIHDDVIDHAATRRGRPTASAAFGNTAAILSGDVLLSKAMALLAHDGDLEIIRTVSQAVVEIAEGEVRELEVRGMYDLSESDHLEVLRMKTASFIQCCCEAGALIAGGGETERTALATYGHHIGMAFQIVDDLLDYRSERTGKPKAGDFREGQATLPLIYLRGNLDQDEADLARRKFGNGVTDDELSAIVGWMHGRGAFERTEAAARAHVARAAAALAPLPESAEKALLKQVGEFVLSRDS